MAASPVGREVCVVERPFSDLAHRYAAESPFRMPPMSSSLLNGQVDCAVLGSSGRWHHALSAASGTKRTHRRPASCSVAPTLREPASPVSARNPVIFLADFPNRAAGMPDLSCLSGMLRGSPTRFDHHPFCAPSPEGPHGRASPRARQGAREFPNNPEGRGILRKFQARCAGLACSLPRARRCAANGPTGRRGPRAEGIRNGHRDH